MLHSSVFRKLFSDNANKNSDAGVLWVPRASPPYATHSKSSFMPYDYWPFNKCWYSHPHFQWHGQLSYALQGLGARSIFTPIFNRLCSVWPSTLSAWDRADTYIGWLYNTFPRHSPSRIIPLSRIDPSSDYYEMYMAPTRFERRIISNALTQVFVLLVGLFWPLKITRSCQKFQSCLTKVMVESTSHLVCQSGMDYLDIVLSSIMTRDVLQVRGPSHLFLRHA